MARRRGLGEGRAPLPPHLPDVRDARASSTTLWRATSPPLFIETQRLSVASQLSVAQEAAEARSLSVAADPRAH